MSFCANQIQDLAASIYEGLNSPSSLSIGYLSGALVSSGTLGELNNRLTTCFWISGGSCIAGGFGPEEAAILGLMVEAGYYRRQALNTLQCGVGGSLFTVIREGDTSIHRASPVEVSRSFTEMRKQAEQDIAVMVANWKLAHTIPLSVDSAPMASYPTP